MHTVLEPGSYWVPLNKMLSAPYFHCLKHEWMVFIDLLEQTVAYNSGDNGYYEVDGWNWNSSAVNHIPTTITRDSRGRDFCLVQLFEDNRGY